MSYELVLDGNPIWSGASGTAPTAEVLKHLLQQRGVLSEQQLQKWTVQILRHAPARSVSSLLSVLSTAFWLDGDLFSLTEARPRRVCGKVFKKGDVVWTCRVCAKDQTCVQCNTCFENSNHVGHDVYFHRAGGNGGCCDCGDPEAWHINGNCDAHGEHKKRRTGAGGSTDDSAAAPTPPTDENWLS